MKMELRIQDSELRSNSDGSMTVSGYVNKTEQLSETLGVTKRFKEKIAKGAFTRALSKAKKVDFLAEHNRDKILASTANGSLELREDSQGLFMSATIANTTWGKDYYELINSGILQNMSFGFRNATDSWSKDSTGMHIRTITDLDLIEVSAVRDPAYSQSSISARSIEIIEEPEVKDVVYEDEKSEDEELQISKLKIQIMKQEDEVRRAEDTLKIAPNSSVFKSVLKRENDKLAALNEELTKSEQRKQGEQKMEERTLQGTTEGQSTISQQVAPIAELLEASSNVVAEARKIELIGVNMKIPYETALDDAAFVLEGENIPAINLNLDERDTLTGKRVGVMQSFSKVLLHEAKGLDEHSKKLLIRRVGKKIEEEILTGDNVKGLKGIAPDSLVPSVGFVVDPTQTMLRALYLKVNAEYRPYCKWYMSEEYFEKVASLLEADGEPLVKAKYLVKSKTTREQVVATLWGHEIEVTTALAAGDTPEQVPVIFASMADCYTLAVAKDIEVTQVVGTAEALSGTVSFKAEALVDGSCHNYMAVAKGVVA